MRILPPHKECLLYHHGSIWKTSTDSPRAMKQLCVVCLSVCLFSCLCTRLIAYTAAFSIRKRKKCISLRRHCCNPEQTHRMHWGKGLKWSWVSKMASHSDKVLCITSTFHFAVSEHNNEFVPSSCMWSVFALFVARAVSSKWVAFLDFA